MRTDEKDIKALLRLCCWAVGTLSGIVEAAQREVDLAPTSPLRDRKRRALTPENLAPRCGEANRELDGLIERILPNPPPTIAAGRTKAARSDL